MRIEGCGVAVAWGGSVSHIMAETWQIWHLISLVHSRLSHGPQAYPAQGVLVVTYCEQALFGCTNCGGSVLAISSAGGLPSTWPHLHAVPACMPCWSSHPHVNFIELR